MAEPILLCNASNVRISEFVHIGRNVTFGPNCRNVDIGVGCFLGNDLYIDVEELSVGDYVTIHHGSVIHGKNCSIGHNCWFGHYTIIDSLGGLTRIGNNVGVGAHSQLWSHMSFGDRMKGCRWYNRKQLIIEDDCWFVGHTIVTPIHAREKSMLMVGGVAVRDMEENHIYGGSPAKDITEHLGPQFSAEPAVEEKREMFDSLVAEFGGQGRDTSFIRIVEELPPVDDRYTCFELETQTYRPRYTREEVEFIKFMLYEKAKFLPVH